MLSKATTVSTIWGVASECAEAGWDGEEAEPISQTAAQQAADFVRALPEGIPLPEVAPEPDGSISLDWIRSRSRLASVSIASNGSLAYAWLDGGDSGRGAASFDGSTIESTILEAIRRT